MKTVIVTIIVLVVLFVVGGLIFVYSGVYDVAATKPHTGLVHWIITTIVDRSIESRAGSVEVPELSDTSLIDLGFEHYNEMCVTCHGAPGVASSVIGEGLYPRPPSLVDEAEELSEGEIYWVTKNGIKMTGMPAFGVTHSEKQVWAMVAFVKLLPDISAEDYQMRLAAFKAEEVTETPKQEAEEEPQEHRHSH